MWSPIAREITVPGAGVSAGHPAVALPVTSRAGLPAFVSRAWSMMSSPLTTIAAAHLPSELGSLNGEPNETDLPPNAAFAAASAWGELETSEKLPFPSSATLIP